MCVRIFILKTGSLPLTLLVLGCVATRGRRIERRTTYQILTVKTRLRLAKLDEFFEDSLRTDCSGVQFTVPVADIVEVPQEDRVAPLLGIVVVIEVRVELFLLIEVGLQIVVLDLEKAAIGLQIVVILLQSAVLVPESAVLGLKKILLGLKKVVLSLETGKFNLKILWRSHWLCGRFTVVSWRPFTRFHCDYILLLCPK